MTYNAVKQGLQKAPKRWLVTGAAGFIGSHLVETLLNLGQEVVGLDNFATGYKENLDDIEKQVGAEKWQKFHFHEGDIADAALCDEICSGIDIILHQGALGSVPRSIDDPVASNDANVTGFLQLLWSAKKAGVRRFVYASSSAVYGDDASDKKVEEQIGTLLSPYAVTKRVNELYSEVFTELYGIECIGLRYFNVFGPRQDPNGAYAAVIPKWIGELLSGATCTIHGDGTTSRDFSYISNVVQGNILAGATQDVAAAAGGILNIACGGSTSLNDLYKSIRSALHETLPEVAFPDVEHGPFRKGDIKHSLATIDQARKILGYAPEVLSDEGLRLTVAWFVERWQESNSNAAA